LNLVLPEMSWNAVTVAEVGAMSPIIMATKPVGRQGVLHRPARLQAGCHSRADDVVPFG
jgi:hypothetical protein